MQKVIKWVSFVTLIPMLFGGVVSASDLPIFRYQGLDYSAADLTDAQQQKLFDIESEAYKKRQEIIDASLIDIYIRDQAEKSEKSDDQLRQELLAAPQANHQEIEKFYNANKARIPYPLEQVRGDIVKYLNQQRQDGRKQDLLKLIKRGGEYQELQRAPESPTLNINYQGFPFKGPKNAKVVVVEFADYQCPHCKHGSDMLSKVYPNYKDRVKLVYMDFPINQSGISRKVAEGAVCADSQGKFWEFNQQAFARQAQLNLDSPKEIATAIVLDMEAFSSCINTTAAKDKVFKAENEARRLGVNSTPTFFVNGKRLLLEDMEADFVKAVDRALQRIKD